MERTAEELNEIISEIVDVLIKHNCTVNESNHLLIGVRGQTEKSTVQK